MSFTNCSTDATSYSWSFGDGTSSTLRSPNKSWSTAGPKTVTLTARGDGGNDSQTLAVTVSQTPSPPVEPTACFSASSTTVDVGQSVTFTNCSTNASTYSWDFDDGSGSSQRSPSHTFLRAGSFTVRLTANGEGSNSTTRTITVNEKAPERDITPRNISCTTHAANDFEWTWSGLPAWVDNYEIGYSDGTSETIGDGGGHRTSRTVTSITAVNGDERVTSAVGNICPPPPTDDLPIPSGVSCRFSNFRSGGGEWTETWTWNNDPSASSYLVRVNENGASVERGAQSRGSHTTSPANGQPDSGFSVKAIIAVGADGSRAERTLSRCGEFDVSGSWGTERAAAGF